MEVQVRWMKREDSDDVSVIRNSCSIKSNLDRFLSSPSFIAKVAEVGDKLAGFLLYSNKGLEIRIKELSVLPEFGLNSVGAAMLGHLISKPEFKSKIIHAFIPEQFLEAHLLFKNMGFMAKSIEKSSKGCSYRFVLER